VILLIDKSGSMDFAPFMRWELAVSAAKDVMKSLTIADHVNIVLFDNIAKILVGSTLIRATKANRKLLENALDAESPGGGTNFVAGFETAFQLLENSIPVDSSSLCHTAILFLTDGISSSDPTSTINTAVAALNLTSPPVIFSYTLGAGATKTLPKSIACDNKGIWQHIDDGGDLRSQMSLYYQYFAIGMADNTTARSTWVEPFNFVCFLSFLLLFTYFSIQATDGKLGTAVSSPVYSYKTNPPMLLGVVGTGLSIEKMLELEPGVDTAAFVTKLISRSQFCGQFSLETCQLEALRKRHSEDSVCLDAAALAIACPFNLDIFNPQPCSNLNYPTNLWCNAEQLSFTDRACCNCTSSTEAWQIAVYVVGTIGAVGACFIVLIVVLLIGAYYVKKTELVAESTESSWTAKEIELPPATIATAPRPAPTGFNAFQPPPSYTPGFAPAINPQRKVVMGKVATQTPTGPNPNFNFDIERKFSAAVNGYQNITFTFESNRILFQLWEQGVYESVLYANLKSFSRRDESSGQVMFSLKLREPEADMWVTFQGEQRARAVCILRSFF